MSRCRPTLGLQGPATRGRRTTVNTSDRTGLYQSLLTTFLAHAKERGYIVIGVLGRSEEYVQFMVHDDRVSGEVGSRQWSEPERPLPGAAVRALGRLGFVGGGPERNFARDGLPRSAGKLAKLTDTLLRTAYDLDEDFSPVVHEIHLNDVTLPRAEPFTCEMIAAHLRDHATHFLRDEDGDFRVELNLPDGGGRIVLWFVADGKDGQIYHVHAHPPEVRALRRGRGRWSAATPGTACTGGRRRASWTWRTGPGESSWGPISTSRPGSRAASSTPSPNGRWVP